MIVLRQHAKIGKIVYEKKFWGTAKITVDGIELTKLNSTMYTYERDGIRYTVIIQGNAFSGIKLNFSSNEKDVKPIIIPIVEPFKASEYIVAFISTILITLWVSIGMFVPGSFFKMTAIEGLIGGAFAFIGLLIAGRTNETGHRILILIITNLLGLGLAVLTTLI